MFLWLLLRHFIPPEIVLRIGPTPSSSYLSFCLWLIVSRVSAEVASICNTSSTQLRSPSICEKSAFGTSASNIISGQNPASWEMGRIEGGYCQHDDERWKSKDACQLSGRQFSIGCENRRRQGGTTLINLYVGLLLTTSVLSLSLFRAIHLGTKKPN